MRKYIILVGIIGTYLMACGQSVGADTNHNSEALAECSQKIDELEQSLAQLEQEGRAIQRRVKKGADEEAVQQANKELQKIREECKALDMPLLKLRYRERKLQGKDLSAVRGGVPMFGHLVKDDMSEGYVLALLDEFPELARTDQGALGNPVDLCAAMTCNTNVLSALLRCGGKPSGTAFFEFVGDQRFRYPLTKNKALACAKMLKSAGANVNARDDTGRTPLHWLLDPDGEHLTTDIRKRLYESRRLANIAKTKGNERPRPAPAGLIDLLKTLGANFQLKDNSGLTPDDLIEKNKAEQEN